MLNALACCPDCACAANGDVASFVAVVVGVLFCTTFWDKPKEKAFLFVCDRVKRRLEKFTKKISSNPDAAQVYDEQAYDALDTCANEQIKTFESSVNGWISSLYIWLAILFGFLGLAELLFSMTCRCGLWNVFLLTPALEYLSFSFFAYIYMCHEIHMKVKDHEAFIRVNIDKAKMKTAANAQEVTKLVPAPPRQ